MPDIGNEAPATTYPYLLQVSGGLDTGLKAVEDGDGTELPINVSIDTITVNSDATFELLSGLINFTTNATTIKLGKTGTTDDYTINLPISIPSSAGKFLMVDDITSDTVTLDWAIITGNALVLGGTGAITSSLQPILDKNNDDTNISLSTTELRYIGIFSNYSFRIYDSIFDKYISLGTDSTPTESYTVLFPGAMPSDTDNRFLAVSGIDTLNSIVTTSWTTIGSFVTTTNNNIFTNENEFQNGIFLSGGPFKMAFSYHLNQSGVALDYSTWINIIVPVSFHTIVTLPPEIDNLSCFISHSGTSLTVTVKDNGGTTIKTLTAGQKFIFMYASTYGWVAW